MKVLFISTSCSSAKYNDIFEMRNTKLIDPQQKFCRLLIEGISSVNEIELCCISALPISASTVDKKVFLEESEFLKYNLKYNYLAFKNGKFSRYLTLYINCYKTIKKWIKCNEKDKKIIICDALSSYLSIPAQILSKKYNVRIVGIITDLPMLSTKMKEEKHSLLKKMGMYIFQKTTDYSLSNYDAYIPLTESINQYVNSHSKPSLIIEGSVDYEESFNDHFFKKRKVILYAGGVYKKYGVKNLVEAFINSNTNGYELHIYGNGTYVKELQEIVNENDKIKYMGVVSQEEIIRKEKEAMILVNPRPCSEEFSKYSFPSKTLEYMSTGTCLITTKLPGIPNDYFEHLYFFAGDGIKDIKTDIERITSLPINELITKGLDAREFVLSNKNNIVQGRKIARFIQCLK